MTDLTTTLGEGRASRREFVVRLGAAGLGVAAGTFLAGCGGSSNTSASGAVGAGEIALAFKDIQSDENDHVTFLTTALGGSARPRPTFDPALLAAPDSLTFTKLAAALENTGTGAYLYAVTAPGLLASPPTLQAAASIAIVEGRHAGFLNSLLGRVLLTSPNASPADSAGPPQPGDPAGFANSQEIPQPPSQVKARAAGFLGTINTGSPPSGGPVAGNTYLNGGPGFPGDDLSGASAVDILNFALFLEYLERDFYNVNVTKFYGGSPAYSQTGP